MKVIQIKEIRGYDNKGVTLNGWVANKRSGKSLVFVTLRDGSGYIQAVFDQGVIGEEEFQKAESLTLESSVSVSGKIVKDERQIGGYEMQVIKLEIYQIAEEYPIAKKEHGVEFLIDNRHLWLRSKRQWAVMRVRNNIIYAIHRFFQDRGFTQMDAPIFTGNAVEGTSTLFETDYFGEPAYLSQSGQLYGEAMAMSLGKIYTFGPTFRAEKSKTRRHLTEFWMIEPEMAFCDNEKNMDLIEEFLQFVVTTAVEESKEELEILERDTTILKNINKTFPRVTYDEAVEILMGKKEVNGKTTLNTLHEDLETIEEDIRKNEQSIQENEERLKKSGVKKREQNQIQNSIEKLKAENKDLEEQKINIPQWIESAENFKYGSDFGGSDETVITRLFDTPIMVYNWPKEIKAFYMKRDEKNNGLVKGVDVLAPEGFGEIVGGGERETDLEFLKEQINIHKLPMKAFEWYLDLRRYGSVPHSGFGLGLERLVGWICKLPHLRESIPFPRMYGRLFP